MDRQLGQGGERSRVEIKCGRQRIEWKMGNVRNFRIPEWIKPALKNTSRNIA